MELNKIEKQFKEQLKSREIKPSGMAWERLDAMLAVAEKPKQNYKWIYVAASFLGFLMLGMLYFDQKNNEILTPNDTIVVNKSKATPKIKATTEKIILSKTVEAIKIKTNQLVSTKIKFNSNSNIVISNTENKISEKEIIQEEQKTIINQKTEQPIVLPKSNYVNVDELLASVENTSLKKSFILTKSNIKVNSNELLTQVDEELDLTFREKVIETVNQNYKTVKLALSNRNSE